MLSANPLIRSLHSFFDTQKGTVLSGGLHVLMVGDINIIYLYTIWAVWDASIYYSGLSDKKRLFSYCILHILICFIFSAQTYTDANVQRNLFQTVQTIRLMLGPRNSVTTHQVNIMQAVFLREMQTQHAQSNRNGKVKGRCGKPPVWRHGRERAPRTGQGYQGWRLGQVTFELNTSM